MKDWGQKLFPRFLPKHWLDCLFLDPAGHPPTKQQDCSSDVVPLLMGSLDPSPTIRLDMVGRVLTGLLFGPRSGLGQKLQLHLWLLVQWELVQHARMVKAMVKLRGAQPGHGVKLGSLLVKS